MMLDATRRFDQPLTVEQVVFGPVAQHQLFPRTGIELRLTRPAPPAALFKSGRGSTPARLDSLVS